MYNQLTEENIVALNMALCEKFNNDFSLKRPHNINLVVKQYDQLSDREEIYRYAYVANSLTRLQPFHRNNQRTALALLLGLPGVTQDKIPTLAGMLKHGADTDHICSILKS